MVIIDLLTITSSHFVHLNALVCFVCNQSSSSSSSITLNDCLFPSDSCFSKCVSKNSSTVSVFHLVIDKVSFTLPFESNNFMMGSKPLSKPKSSNFSQLEHIS
uniref:Uncharacterized protein n=1 Tax=Glossina brevipalpis TaxID=37001 RepID=A0A1A9WPZ5_9MUSC